MNSLSRSEGCPICGHGTHPEAVFCGGCVEDAKEYEALLGGGV